MDQDREYKFRIDAYSPESIPMASLAAYMADLAELLGHEKSVHFERLETGSTRIVHRVEFEDVPKVEARLRAVGTLDSPSDLSKAFKALDKRLASDNATGSLSLGNGRKVIKFPGRDRPKPIDYGTFRQPATIQGVLVRIGGKDSTAHATIQEGDVFHSNVELKRDLARQIAPHLFGRPIRLQGSGRWYRSPEGEWELQQFSVNTFELLDDASLRSATEGLRKLLPKEESIGSLKFLTESRSDEDDD